MALGKEEVHLREKMLQGASLGMLSPHGADLQEHETDLHQEYCRRQVREGGAGHGQTHRLAHR